MKSFIFHLFTMMPLFANLPALPESGSLSSSDASYDGNSLHLTGHVVLDHGLGKMTAEEAFLERQETGKDFPFSFIQLRKSVLLALKNSAQVCCERADLDFTALKGILHASEQDKVVYSDYIKKKKGGELIPLKLSSKQVDLLFSKCPRDDKKTDYDIQNILAKQEVTIDYADQFRLQAEQAIYRKEQINDKTSRREFQGTITAYPKEGFLCHLSHQGDAIEAEMVDLDLVNARISLLRPKGVLATVLLPHLQKGDIRFHSDHLIWDHNKNTLILKGHIFIEDAMLGIFQAQDELQIIQSTKGGKNVLQAIDAHGSSSLVYKDSHQRLHKLISQGRINLDRDKLLATIESPENNGVTGHDKQLYYEEEEFAIFADHASLEYSIENDTLQPTLLSLRGNIRLFSHDTQKPFRCGSADRLTYSLTTRTLILSANPGKKVLFWDDAQEIHLSAPEVHITHDPETKQHNVKGIGAVQFAFTPDEQSKLMRLFPQLKKL